MHLQKELFCMKDNELKEQVSKWIELAEEDFRLAKFAFKMKSNVPYRLICYHAQQTAEKYIKGYLVSELIDFPYTHSIEALLKLTPSNSGLQKLMDIVSELTNYAVAKRYPGDYNILTKKNAEEAVNKSSKVRKAIRELLKEKELL